MTYDVIFQFNNIYKPYFLIKIYDEGKIKKVSIDYDFSQLENGLPANKEELIEQINHYVDPIGKKCLFLLNCDEFFKTTHVLPNIQERKLRRLYETELSSEFPDYGDYSGIGYDYDINTGHVFYRYFISHEILNYFNEIATEAGFSLCHYDTLTNYLLNFFNDNVKGKKYVATYQENDVVTLLTIRDKIVCSACSFGNDKESFNRYYLAYAEKHTLELEKDVFEDLYTNIEDVDLTEYQPKMYKYIIGSNKYDGKEF